MGDFSSISKTAYFFDKTTEAHNPDLELVLNGGAPIDSIIKYYQEHGECI